MSAKPVFQASLDQFEGPLDLMLHLVSQNRLDLFKLDLYALATQYVAFIMGLDDLNAASEYMVEFARLLEYKSKKLLPVLEVEEEEALIAEYSNRLLDYQHYKQGARLLEKSRAIRKEWLERPEDQQVIEWKSNKKEELAKGDISRLKKMFERLMSKRSFSEPAIVLEKRDVSLQQIKEQVRNWFTLHHRATLEELLELYPSRQECIVCFLVVLEAIHERSLIWNGTELINGDQREG